MIGIDEYLILSSVFSKTDHSAHGWAITADLKRAFDDGVLNIRCSRSSVYKRLEALTHMGYLGTFEGDPKESKTGTARKYYTLLPAGIEALRQVHAVIDVWQEANARQLDKHDKKERGSGGSKEETA